MRGILIALITVSLITMTVLLYVNRRYRGGLEVGKIRVSASEVEIDEVSYTETKDGNLLWRMEADSAHYLKEEDLVVLKDVTVIYYSGDEVNYTLKGNKGRFWQDSGDIEVTGDVELQSEDGYSLSTELLRYIASKRIITSDSMINATGPKVRLEGTGLVVFIETEKFTVPQRVKVWMDGVLL